MPQEREAEAGELRDEIVQLKRANRDLEESCEKTQVGVCVHRFSKRRLTKQGFVCAACEGVFSPADSVLQSAWTALASTC